MTEAALAYFVAFLYKEGLAAGTVRSYLSTAHYTQILWDYRDPNVAAML